MRCHSCFKPIENTLYCNKCKKELFGGKTINRLSFDKREFYQYRQSNASRMSISGVQDKISLKLEGNNLVPTDINGEYILKPVPSAHLEYSEDIVPNEHLSMQLSSQIFGIPTALNAIVLFNDGEMAYLAKRFDYAKDGTKLDQEDFAAVIGTSEQSDGENYKYDSTYEAIAMQIKNRFPASRIMLEDFFKRVLFNYLIGNGDAHLKNFSIYRPEGRDDYDLTPNYDVLFTKYHMNETVGEMALELFETIETRSYGALGFYSMEDFQVFADLLEIPPKRQEKIYSNLFGSIKKAEGMIQSSFMSEEGKQAYLDNFIARIEKRLCHRPGQKGYEFESVIIPFAEQYLKSH